jgi:tetratricopeptide (TPR) repeat protein
MSAVPPNPPTETTAKEDWPPLAPPVRKQLQQCYEKAKLLLAQAKVDHDYAHTLLAGCVLADPGNVVYLDAFFENLSRKYNNNKKGAALQFFTNRSAFKKCVQTKDWKGMIRAGIDLLKINPWDVATLRPMADACEHYSLNDGALYLLRMGLKGHPQHVELNRHAAQLLGRLGHFDQAIAVWAKVNEYTRGDEEADRMITRLQLEKTYQLTGKGENPHVKPPAPKSAKTYDPAMEDPLYEPPPEPQPLLQPDRPAGAAIPRAPEKEQLVVVNLHAGEVIQKHAPKHREVHLTATQKVEHAIADDPSYLPNYFQLAEMYVAEGRPANAERVLSRALHVSGNHLHVQERLEEVQILRAEQQLAIAEKAAQADPSEEAQDLVKQLRDSLHRLELDVFGRRRDRYPQESRWRLELGMRLKKMSSFAEAAKLLSSVTDPPEMAIKASLLLGECWQQLRKYPQAMQAYRSVIDHEKRQDQPETLKLALYRAGILGVALQDQHGVNSLRQLVALDPHFRDAKERLDKLTGIGQNG